MTGRSSPLTIGAIAVVAYALTDMIHEVLGHGVATLASKDVTAVMLTTVALSTNGSSRMVAAAGTLANLAAAAIAFTLLRRKAGASSFRYFLWLLASLDLLNATAYLLYSGILGSGDWAVVVDGFEPAWLVRAGMIAAGAVTYALSVRASAISLRRLVREGALPWRDVPRLASLPYWVGGALLVAGAAMNPVSPFLILTSGAATGFGAMAGLLLVPWAVGAPAREDEDRAAPLPLQPGWVVAGAVVAAVFVLVIGRGIVI